MPLQRCYTASEDKFPLPAPIRERYGPFGFPEPADPSRPYISSNFVMALDGKASFRELPGRAGGREVSRSKDDRWLMDFLRAHHDGQFMGAATLRDEPGPDGLGWDFGIDDAELIAYRQQTLGLGRQKIILLTGSGDIDLNLRVFNSPRIEPWIVTGAEGERRLRPKLTTSGRALTIVRVGDGAKVDLGSAVRLLRKEHGIRTLLCEGGPTLYGEMLNRRLIDEDFRTIALQVMGKSGVPTVERPTPYGNVSYIPETAPWFRLISVHLALPYHAFLRLRYVGPRTFDN